VNLSNAYHAQYGSHSLEDDLRKALDLVETAHQDCLASFSHTSWLSATNIYLKYFLLSGVRSYLDTALDRFKNALNAFPEEDNFTNKYLVFFAGGHIFWEFYKIKKSQEDMDFAIAYYLACWEAVAATPIIRIKAARSTAKLFCSADNPLEAWNLLQQAVDLILIACPGSSKRKEQQLVMSQLSGLGNEACSTALAVGVHPLDALEVLERRRSIIIAAAHGAASQLADLEDKSPELYREYNLLRTKINTSDSEFRELQPKVEFHAPSLREGERLYSFYGGITQQEYQFSEIERVTQQIRDEVPGFKDFMIPLSKSRIQILAQDGLIVTLVASSTRADAILLTNAGTKVLSLTLPDPP